MKKPIDSPLLGDVDGLTELLKEQHYYELERKDRILSNLSLPIGFLSLSSGGFIYFSQHFPLRDVVWAYLFCISMIASTVLFVVAAYYAAATFHGRNGYEYAYLPSPDVQLGYYRACLKAYQSYSDAPALSMSALKNYMIPIYSKAAHLNRTTNNQRADYLYYTNAATLSMMLFLGFAVTFFSMCRYDAFTETLGNAPPGKTDVPGVILMQVVDRPGGAPHVRERTQRKGRAAAPRAAASSTAPSR